MKSVGEISKNSKTTYSASQQGSGDSLSHQTNDHDA